MHRHVYQGNHGGDTVLTLGNIIGLSIESFCIIIICIYLMDDARKAMTKHKGEGASSDGTAMFIVATIWTCWRLWINGYALIEYLGWRWT
ncbi:MAG: hypothetical protein NC311_06720 [Muribaculaceae bacterium]|nr:hypothetical protein [Muribaculaceae bacterium]